MNAPSEAIRGRIQRFAQEWVTQVPPDSDDARQRDVEFLAACIEQIVDDAVREAILTTSSALKRPKSPVGEMMALTARRSRMILSK